MKMTSQEVGLLRIIADSVDDYLQNKSMVKPDHSSVVRTMEMVLPKLLPTYHFEVSWHYTKKPFIACIHPDIDELNKKSAELMNILNDPKKGNQDYVEKWCEIKHWVILLDPRVLTKGDPCCVDDGNQFVAILCHELGHIFTRDPIAFVANYRKMMNQMSTMEKMMMAKSPIIRKLILPMFVHTQQFLLIVNKKTDDEMELAADAYVPNEFKGALISYITNHVLVRPDTHGLVINKAEYDNEQQMAINYSKSTVDLMKRRRDVLKKQINAQYHSPDSDAYMKNLLTYMGKAVGSYNPSTDDTNVLAEAYDIKDFERQYDRVVAEAMAVLEAIKVTDRELTILEIEASNIQNNEDKLYVIQTIYDYIEAVSKQQADTYKKKKKSMTDAEIKQVLAADNRLDRLQKLRSKVMAMDVDDDSDHYGLFIRYPKGYEG